MISNIIDILTEAVTWGKYDYDKLIELKQDCLDWVEYYNSKDPNDKFKASITTLIQECDIAISDIKYKMDCAEEIERQRLEN